MIHETFSETFNYSKEYHCLVLNFDGSCQPCNPNGDMGFGWCISSYDEVIAEGWGYEIFNDTRRTTNNMAEWYSMYYGLKFIIDNNISYDKLIVKGDSQFVINQAKGKYKINPDKAYTEIANKYLYELRPEMNFKKTEFIWVPRSFNDYCDTLSNKFIKHIKNL